MTQMIKLMEGRKNYLDLEYNLVLKMNTVTMNKNSRKTQ